MKNINIHISPSRFRNASRILKITKSLAANDIFDKIYIVVLWEEGLAEHETLDDKREVWRVPLRTAKMSERTLPKIIKHIEWLLKIHLRFRNETIKCVNCHTLSSLPIGMLFKLLHKSKVIYDTHELETERDGWGKARKILAKILEKILISKTDLVIVVSDSIAQWYKNRYGLKTVYTIRNIPYQQNTCEHSSTLKERFNIKNDEILYVYSGVVGSGRGIEILLNTFSKVDRKKHIVFMGYGALEDTIKRYETSFSNIHFQPAVRPEDVKNYVKGADVGIPLAENTCLSYFYGLPNKFFEYLLSGLPVLVSDFPDVGKLVTENNCGWKVLPDENLVTALIERISKKEIREKKDNAMNCRHNFGWEIEEKKLLEAYQTLDIQQE